MILDNENDNLKVHEWTIKYTQTGKLLIHGVNSSSMLR